MRSLIVASLAALAVSISAVTGGASAAPRVALLIGNADYRHESRLRNPSNDVAAMRRRLETLGFEVTQALDSDRASMTRALVGFRRRAAEADTAVLFYSGHGMEAAGRNYLIPVDATLAYPDDAEVEAVALEFAVSVAAKARRLSVVIVDACRNNRFPGAQRSGAKGFRSTRARPGQLIAFATSPGAVAYDGDGDLSPFTQALTEMLGRADAPRMDVRQLFGGLGRRVSELVRQPQEPFTHASGFGPEAVTLLGATAGGREATKPSDVQPRGAPDPAKQAYDAAHGSDDPRRLELVTESYPDSYWGRLAALEAEDLRAARSGGGSGDQPARAAGPADPSSWKPGEAAYRAAQGELKRLGLYDGGIDGLWGAGSRAALRSFQRAMRLSPEDGALTEAGLETLQSTSVEGWLEASLRDLGGEALDAVKLGDGGRLLTSMGVNAFIGRNGVRQDYKAAYRLFGAGCLLGSARGCGNMGVHLRDGRGVPKNASAAVYRFRQGCDGDDARSCANLGHMYSKGRGVKKDPKEVARLNHKACEGGDAGGCTFVGNMYRFGFEHGKDLRKASEYYRKGCDGGYAKGCSNLAILYRDGEGVAADRGAAVRWFKKALEIDSGLAEARKALEALGEKP